MYYGLFGICIQLHFCISDPRMVILHEDLCSGILAILCLTKMVLGEEM